MVDDSLVGRMWRLVKYSPTTLTCGNCAHLNGKGECTVISGVTFGVFQKGICKHHSNFNAGNIKFRD